MVKSVKEILKSYAEFNEEGKHINGTDKQSNHNYGDAYGMLFPPRLREKVKLVMEIGVADGSCLLAWRDVFPNATIVGMDIHSSDKAKGHRIEFYLGNQTSKQDCDRVAGNRKFDIIIEDAKHTLENSLLTLLYMWPYVKEGGYYIIEEFANIRELRKNVALLFDAQIQDTVGPFGGIEPLVILQKHPKIKD